MAKDTNLTAQEIYEKVFSTVEQGYSAEEVDTYLDEIIEDYQAFAENMEELGRALIRYEDKIKGQLQQIASLQAENQELKARLEKLESVQETTAAETAVVTEEVTPEKEMTLEERVSRLEQAVFKSSND